MLTDISIHPAEENPQWAKPLDKLINGSHAPFFFYDLDSLEVHLRRLRALESDDVKLWYACKANPMSAIIKVLRNLGFGFDIASIGELEQVQRTSLENKNLIATGPAKSKLYLAELVDRGLQTVVLESINQLKWLNEVAQERDVVISALLRVQLSWKLEKTSVLGGHEITPFGITPDEWSTVRLRDFPNVDILGLHTFQWGNINTIDELRTIWNETIIQLKPLIEKLGINFRVLDLGGGLGIPYEDNFSPIKIEHISEALREFRTNHNVPKLWLELGRYSVGSCGRYFAQVIDRKHVRGTEILVLNGGINHIARPALTGQAFPCHLWRQSEQPGLKYQVHGPLCTSLDKLGSFTLPNDVKVGDWLVFSQAGAYGFTESMPMFLCHDLPAEVIYYKENLMVPRVSKKSHDWLI